jgi:hypothetical protein
LSQLFPLRFNGLQSPAATPRDMRATREAPMKDQEVVAAHLAAALITPTMTQAMVAAKGGPAAAAVKVYFEVLDALAAEDKRRQKPQDVPAVPPATGR